MQQFYRFLYGFIVLPLLWATLMIIGVFNGKTRRGIRGRRNLFDTLARQTSTLSPGKRVWFHSSSLGEFEQAKPIIAELKSRMPDARVIVTFFFPFGLRTFLEISPC